MNILDYMVMLSELNDCLLNKEKAIFNYFKIDVPEGFVLILPERFHSAIGDFSEKIIFSPYTPKDTFYLADKTKMDNILKSVLKLTEDL